MIRLSTSTNIMDRYNKVQGAVSMQDCLIRCKDAGYNVIDMNFHDMSNTTMPMAQDNWQDWVLQMKDLGDKLGLEFSQSHAYFYNFMNPSITQKEWREELIRRSIIASGMMKIPWVTMHAGTDSYNGYSTRGAKAKNLEYFAPYIDLAAKHHVGICFENMYDPTPQTRTFTASTEDLIDLVDSFKASNVGITWDFGHAHLQGVDQCACLRQIGDRLKSTHVNDNRGTKDDHLIPYYGEIVWEPILQTLGEIGYEHDFTYEVTPFLDRVPPVLRDSALLHTVEVGEYMIGLIKK